MNSIIRRKIFEPLSFNTNRNGYNECNWELSACDDIEVFKYQDQYWCAIIDGKICLYLLNNEFKGYMDFSKDIPSHIDHDGEKYDIVYLFLRCQKWNLSLPETIEDVIIDRTLSGNSSYDRNHLFGDSKNSKFSVEKSKFFYSENGSLYSYDKKVLYHFYNGNDNNIVDSVEHIAPNAIYNPGRISLSIPIDVKEIKKNAIIGGFKEVDFKGKLVSIENGALDNIKNYGNNILIIKINGLLSDLTAESCNELKKWKSKDYKNELILLAPEPTYGRVLEDGYIELTKVLTTNEKLLARADSDKVCINSYINEQFEDRTDIRIPIIWDTLKLDYNDKEIDSRYSNYRDIYSPTNVTRIVFVADTKTREGLYEVLVHESEGKVKELIHMSYQKAKRR